jgi:1,4-dihydroxy-2-naphthoate octaprenyltransferase
VFVFVFFGLVSTFGVYFMFSKSIDWLLLLPAIAIGFLSVGVLNLNNMRDEASDRKSGKNTLVVKMGGAAAKKYHYFLVISAMILVLVFAFLNDFHFDQYIFVVAYFPMISHLITVYRNQNPKFLDPELKKISHQYIFTGGIVGIVPYFLHFRCRSELCLIKILYSYENYLLRSRNHRHRNRR